MYSRSLFLPDFAKCFFIRYAQIYEAYVERTLIKFVYSWRKNSRKSGCKGDNNYYIQRILEVQSHILSEWCSLHLECYHYYDILLHIVAISVSASFPCLFFVLVCFYYMQQVLSIILLI